MATVLVLYHSQEVGNTKAMAEAVAQGAKEAGAKVRLVNTNEKRLDIEDFRSCNAVALGTPDYFSYIAGGLKVFLDDLFIARGANKEGLSNKQYALFYSHGGGGAVKGPLEKLFADLGTKVGETVESKGRPNERCLKSCMELGRKLAKAAG